MFFFEDGINFIRVLSKWDFSRYASEPRSRWLSDGYYRNFRFPVPPEYAWISEGGTGPREFLLFFLRFHTQGTINLIVLVNFNIGVVEKSWSHYSS